mgnify:CR=1 FL=1
MDTDNNLKYTSLYSQHVTLNAKIVDFAGWAMPIQYDSILAEAKAVRSSAGIFDISHMGRIEISGQNATSFLNKVVTFDVIKMLNNQAKYGFICNDNGGILDDVILYRILTNKYLLVPNASNKHSILQWLHKWAPSSQIDIKDNTETSSMISIQGPMAIQILDTTFNVDISTLKYFYSKSFTYENSDIFIAQTGYTGEIGFEMLLDHSIATKVWQQLILNGSIPCGLGARDILRLEAGLPLYGHELTLDINPYQANLGKFVTLNKTGNIADNSLNSLSKLTQDMHLIGFKMLEKAIPRTDNKIFNESNQEIGYVTSGSFSPYLDIGIGMGYVQRKYLNSSIKIAIRNKIIKAEIVKLPFYTKTK